MIYEKFPFGKYKGYELTEIPTTYLTYAIEEFDLPDELKDSIKVILCLRLDITVTIKGNLVRSIYRSLSKKYHPDSGGTNESFNAINDFYTKLLEYERKEGI